MQAGGEGMVVEFAAKGPSLSQLSYQSDDEPSRTKMRELLSTTSRALSILRQIRESVYRKVGMDAWSQCLTYLEDKKSD